MAEPVETARIQGLIQTAVVVPRLSVGNIEANTAAIVSGAVAAAAHGAVVAVFPELSLTGYTLGDLVQQPVVLDKAKQGLIEIARRTAKLPLVLTVGLPLAVGDRLYNVAAVVAGGAVIGFVPKTYLPNYQEFYDARWYTSAQSLKTTAVELDGAMVPIGTDLLFDVPSIPGLTLGVEICEDLWAPLPPSSLLAPLGATVIANLSASNELAGKAAYRRQLVANQSGRLRAAYLYSSSGSGESTTDVIFSGHGMIADNGQIIAETERFARDEQVIIADIDLEHLAFDRRRSGTFELPQEFAVRPMRHLSIDLAQPAKSVPAHTPERSPFIPSNDHVRDVRTAEIFRLQSSALASRLEQSGIDEIVLGLSGGLDSTLALLVAVQALHELNLPLTKLHVLTLPGLATSNRTKSNAYRLCSVLGLEIEEITIGMGSTRQLEEIGHDTTTQDTTYQNVQARYRTALMLGRANQLHAMVLGTGDLSEIALGWSTFNGDHISHYHVNAGVPKTLVRYLVDWAAAQPQFKAAQDTLLDIVATPISPELATGVEGELDQITESYIGPYELTDFFLYHFIRWGDEPTKLLALAESAFAEDYTPDELKHWLGQFIKNFFGAQWKRSVMPDGPKIGSVALSPRGDWRMPSSMSAKLWADELQ